MHSFVSLLGDTQKRIKIIAQMLGKLTADLFRIENISWGEFAVTGKEALTSRLNGLSSSGTSGTLFPLTVRVWKTLTLRALCLKMSQVETGTAFWKNSSRPTGERAASAAIVSDGTCMLQSPLSLA